MHVITKLYDADNPNWAPSLKLGYESCHSARKESMKHRMKMMMEQGVL